MVMVAPASGVIAGTGYVSVGSTVVPRVTVTSTERTPTIGVVTDIGVCRSSTMNDCGFEQDRTRRAGTARREIRTHACSPRSCRVSPVRRSGGRDQDDDHGRDHDADAHPRTSPACRWDPGGPPAAALSSAVPGPEAEAAPPWLLGVRVGRPVVGASGPAGTAGVVAGGGAGVVAARRRGWCGRLLLRHRRGLGLSVDAGRDQQQRCQLPAGTTSDASRAIVAWLSRSSSDGVTGGRYARRPSRRGRACRARAAGPPRRSRRRPAVPAPSARARNRRCGRPASAIMRRHSRRNSGGSACESGARRRCRRSSPERPRRRRAPGRAGRAPDRAASSCRPIR